jgi:predicted Kef-type K+ transport protein
MLRVSGAGMLFERGVPVDDPLRATVAIVIVGRPLAATLQMLALRHPPNTAFVVVAR